jgi:hypothetical protein
MREPKTVHTWWNQNQTAMGNSQEEFCDEQNKRSKISRHSPFKHHDFPKI